jgi:hypothetical protein
MSACASALAPGNPGERKDPRATLTTRAPRPMFLWLCRWGYFPFACSGVTRQLSALSKRNRLANGTACGDDYSGCYGALVWKLRAAWEWRRFHDCPGGAILISPSPSSMPFLRLGSGSVANRWAFSLPGKCLTGRRFLLTATNPQAAHVVLALSTSPHRLHWDRQSFPVRLQHRSKPKGSWLPPRL